MGCAHYRVVHITGLCTLQTVDFIPFSSIFYDSGKNEACIQVMPSMNSSTTTFEIQGGAMNVSVTQFVTEELAIGGKSLM